MITINDFTEFKKGDIVSLSNYQIMVELNQISVDFELKDIREYTDPNGYAHYTGYLLHTHLDAYLMYMLMIRRVGSDVDIILYYLDTEGDVSEAGQIVLSEDGQNLQKRFDLALTDSEGNIQEVTWGQKAAGTLFGVKFSDSESDDNTTKTIAEYCTNDECGNNPHAFLEWSGDSSSGWVELWVGHELKLIDIQLYKT